MVDSSQRHTIAIDIDDVLAANAKGFVEFSNKKWGTSLAPEDYNENWAHMWQIDHLEAEERAQEFHKSGVLAQYEHYPEAVAVLSQLKEKFNLIIITSRRLQMVDDTKEWIEKYYPGIFADTDIHFAGIWDTPNKEAHAATKGQIAKDLSVDYIIDDQLKHCLAASQLGVKAILFGDYTWNRSMEPLPSNMVRAANWREVSEFFNGC